MFTRFKCIRDIRAQIPIGIPLVLLATVAPGWAAFPLVAGSHPSSEETNTTAFDPLIPTPISSSELLFAYFSVDAATTITWNTGWTCAPNGIRRVEDRR